MTVRIIATLATLATLACGRAGAQEATLNYRNADLQAYIDDVTIATGRTIIVDPRVQGRVTVISGAPADPELQWEIFKLTLEVNGFVAVPSSSGVFKIVPQQIAPLQASGEGTMMTEVFNLEHADSNNVLAIVKPLVNTNGRVVTYQGGSVLVVVDFPENVARVRRVIEEVDRDRSVVRTILLKNTSADEVVRILDGLRGGGRPIDGPEQYQATAAEGSRVVILRGAPAKVAELEALVARLDAQNESRSAIRVVRLKHADAESLTPLLQEVAGAVAAETGEDGGARGTSGAPGVSLSFDKATNAVIINAGPETQNALASVIAQLDVRRSQVYVEAVIAEVSDTASRALGLQYALGGDGENSRIPFTATNFSNTAPNVLAATGAIALPEFIDGEEAGEESALQLFQEAAVNSLLGLSGFAAGFGGATSDGTIFGVIVNALQSDVGSNVLSTPSALVLDNEEAILTVGQDVPITQGEVLGSDFANPFRTVSREQVGVTLQVTPQITEGDTITLKLRQEVSSVIGPVVEGSSDLVFSNRELSTTISADDGDIIVLGGLIERNEQIDIQRVPILGDIPLVGRLFRSESRSRDKTNLMIFLRPVIVRDSEDLRRVSARKYDLVRSEQIRRTRGDAPGIDALVEDVLGARPPDPADDGG